MTNFLKHPETATDTVYYHVFPEELLCDIVKNTHHVWIHQVVCHLLG